MFIATAEIKSTRPSTRLPPIQPRSDETPAPLASTITNESNANPMNTPPSAANSEGSPGIPLTPVRLTPTHRLDAGLGEQQERADDHREVGEVAGVDEALEQLLEVLAGGHPVERAAQAARATQHAQLGDRRHQQETEQQHECNQEAHHLAARHRRGERADRDVGPA